MPRKSKKDDKLSPILRIEGLSKRFGSFYALDNISFEVPRGSIVLLIGPNGSGKTTLINCISGVYKKDSGRIWFDGIEITGKKPHEIVEAGACRSFQIPALFRSLTVIENLMVCDQNHPGEGFVNSVLRASWKRHENKLIHKAFNMLKTVGLEHVSGQLASELSGGQMKLLELGKMLMLGSKLVMFDEPIGGVNPVLAHEVLHHVQRIKDNLGVSFLIVEHRLALIRDYAGHVCVLSKGKLACEGTCDEVFDSKEFYEVYL